MIVTRKSPVKVSLRQPAYVPSSSPYKAQSQSQSQSQRPHLFTTQNPGFGSRHVHDKAPFSLWDYESSTFREPLARELDWMFATYRFTRYNHQNGPTSNRNTSHHRRCPCSFRSRRHGPTQYTCRLFETISKQSER